MIQFNVTLSANLYQNDGQENYSQKYTAKNIETSEIQAEYYTGRIANSYPHLVLQKTVSCENGRMAILKFRRWQNEGLPEEYLYNRNMSG